MAIKVEGIVVPPFLFPLYFIYAYRIIIEKLLIREGDEETISFLLL
jgi:hypothetical protein